MLLAALWRLLWQPLGLEYFNTRRELERVLAQPALDDGRRRTRTRVGFGTADPAKVTLTRPPRRRRRRRPNVVPLAPRERRRVS